MPEHPDKKKKHTVYLDPEITRMLADFAARRGQSRSIIAEAAIASFLSPDADEQQEAAITKRLDQLTRQVQRLERDIGITNEALAIFIRSWLNATATTSLPQTAQAAARAKGGERYDKFLEVLGRRLAKGPRLRQEVPEDVPATDQTDLAK